MTLMIMASVLASRFEFLLTSLEVCAEVRGRIYQFWSHYFLAAKSYCKLLYS